MVSTASLAASSEMFDRYDGPTAGPRPSNDYADLLALVRVCAGAATLGLVLAAMTPTAGQPNTASTDRPMAGDPPDLVSLLPAALTNQLSMQRAIDGWNAPTMSTAATVELRRLRSYGDGWNGPKSHGAIASSFDVAERFVRMLAAKSPWTKIDPTIFADGSAVIELSGTKLSGLIRFQGDGSIEAALDLPDELDFVWPKLGDALPLEMAKIA